MKKKTDPGISSTLAVVLILALLILFTGVYEYLRMVAIVEQVDQAVELSVQGVASENWENIYQGVREGYAGTYSKGKLTDEWEEVMNKDQILEQLKSMIDFQTESGTWVKRDEQGNVMFTLKPKETTVKILNTSISADEGEALLVETTNTISIPWVFLDSVYDAPPVEIKRKTVCGYTPRF